MYALVYESTIVGYSGGSALSTEGLASVMAPTLEVDGGERPRGCATMRRPACGPSP